MAGWAHEAYRVILPWWPVDDPDAADILTRKEAAAYLATLGYRVSPDHLCNMASNNNAGNGPRFRRIGQRVIRYQRGDLKKWLDERSTWVE